jgi:hypothetical protein
VIAIPMPDGTTREPHCEICKITATQCQAPDEIARGLAPFVVPDGGCETEPLPAGERPHRIVCICDVCARHASAAWARMARALEAEAVSRAKQAWVSAENVSAAMRPRVVEASPLSEPSSDASPVGDSSGAPPEPEPRPA